MERKVFTKKDWNRLGCRFIRGMFVVLLFPIIALIWLARFIDDYGSDFVYWIDNLVEKMCWYYVKWRN